MKIFSTPSKNNTEKFYDNLTEGGVERNTLGIEQRFNIDKLINKKIVRENFIDFILPYVNKKNSKVLDFGCGPGTFSFLISPYCHHVTGIDISKGFITLANDYKKTKNYLNIDFTKVGTHCENISDNSYDIVLLVDVIHHLDQIDDVLKVVERKLKPNGQVLIFEPNLLNPAILLMHMFDPNEWGLLKLGRISKYRQILSKRFSKLKYKYNGIVIGPENKIFYFLSGLLNHPWLYPFIGWLNPKIFISVSKKNELS
jgi:ubiquinone/menaquinone biosynthesis C-methylase UbiE